MPRSPRHASVQYKARKRLDRAAPRAILTQMSPAVAGSSSLRRCTSSAGSTYTGRYLQMRGVWASWHRQDHARRTSQRCYKQTQVPPQTCALRRPHLRSCTAFYEGGTATGQTTHTGRARRYACGRNWAVLASWLMPGCRKSQGTRPTKSAQGVSCSARSRAGAAPVAFLSASSCAVHAAHISGVSNWSTNKALDPKSEWAHSRMNSRCGKCRSLRNAQCT